MNERPGRLRTLTGSIWARLLLAAVFGVLSAAALPPYYGMPALWIGLGGLAYLNMTAATWRRAAFEGWLFGLGWFGAGLYWIGNAFLVDAEQFGALMPFAVAGISAGMALYVALSSGLVSALLRRSGGGPLTAVPVFAGCWTLAEWLRGLLLTGFPWNPLASVWGISPEIMQSAAWLGALGLGFLTAAVFAAPAAVVAAPGTRRRHAVAMMLGVSMLLPLLWGAGALRLAGAGTVTRDDVALRLVQPAIPQALKWQANLRQQHVLKQMAMSKRTPGPAGAPKHVIWAETNVPYLITPDSEVPASLAAAVPEGGTLTFGAPRQDAQGRVFNSLFVIDDDGDILATFDKFHLVPFGEYVPFRNLLPLNKLTAGRGDFTPGPGPRTIKAAGLPPFAPVICYEIIFAGNVVDASSRPEWILNITNDAWFGPSTGPRQHLVQARLRAVEEGLPVVRVANTGISAVIDPFGRVRNRLGLDRQGVVDAPLPMPEPPTLISYLGQTVGLLLALAGMLAGFAPAWRARFPGSG